MEGRTRAAVWWPLGRYTRDNVGLADVTFSAHARRNQVSAVAEACWGRAEMSGREALVADSVCLGAAG